MKKLMLGLSLVLHGAFAQAQGLEKIIVEKYYISDANDATDATGGTLPVGSVTYRIYVDMLPGYKYQALYGIASHELRIATTTLFFNNEDRGATNANAIAKTQLKNNTVMLDSWFSSGAGSAGNFGILKTEDTGFITNADSFLQNADPMAGPALTTVDGLVTGTPEAVTFVGLTTELDVFDASNDPLSGAGKLFTTSNGSIASLNGSVGPTATNSVLVAQITTDGVLTFELNIQIGTPTGGVENYVAKNPTGNEMTMADLAYNSSLVTSVAQTAKIKSSPDETFTTFNSFPNPVSNELTLEFATAKQSIATSYSIFDIMGNEVFHKELGRIGEKQLELIDVTSFSSGAYILALTSGGTTSYKKIIKN